MSRKVLTQDELDNVIDEHAMYMCSAGHSGKQGDLTDKDISHLIFELEDLEGMIRNNAKVAK